jgi:copper chaperone CopZ
MVVGWRPFAMTPQSLDLKLTGMTCAACAARIERVLNRTDGVHATVNSRPRPLVEFDVERAPRSR